MTRGYLLIWEAKATLTDDTLEEALNQLQRRINIFKDSFLSNLNQNWKIIRMVYGTNIQPQVLAKIPQDSQAFLVTENDLEPKLGALLQESYSASKDWSYVKDFHDFVHAILPAKVRIAKDLIQIFALNDSTKSYVDLMVKKMKHYSEEEEITMEELEKISYYKKLLEKVQDNLDKGG